MQRRRGDIRHYMQADTPFPEREEREDHYVLSPEYRRLFARVLNYAKANGLKEKFNAMQGKTGARVKQQGDFLGSHTVLETLQWMNSDSNVAADIAAYLAFVPFGEPYEYAGSDLLAAWYQRNIRIYRNIVALIESPSDRILVVYGAGHLGWLRQDVSNDATVTLRKLGDLF